MKMPQYIRSLLPGFDKSQVMEDIRLLREDLKVNTLPPFLVAEKEIGKLTFQAKGLSEFQKAFDRSVKTRAKGNYVSVVSNALENADEILDHLEHLADKTYADDVNKAGLTFLKANLLQYIEAISFVNKYSRRLLAWTFKAELNALDGNASAMGKELNKVEGLWMSKHQQTFFIIIDLLGRGPKETAKGFQRIPDIAIVEENIEVIENTVGKTKLDPFRMNLVPTWMNPIYHVRMAVAEWQVARMKAGKEEKALLEMRLLQMRGRLSDNPEDAKDARLEQQIEYTEERLAKLSYKLSKMEE